MLTFYLLHLNIYSLKFCISVIIMSLPPPRHPAPEEQQVLSYSYLPPSTAYRLSVLCTVQTSLCLIIGKVEWSET